MESLFNKQERLIALTSTKIIRPQMNSIHWDARLIAIRGSRGVGKTTLMLQYVKMHYGASSREALYCSLDSLFFSSHSLLELAEAFYLAGGKHLFLDEVHKYKTWSREIKEIYDLYPTLKVVISGSSLLNILNADADLSRRCLSYTLPGLSFREFLLFYKDIDLPSHSLEEILTSHGEICAEVNAACRPVAMLNEYLRVGYYPFYKGNAEDYYMQIESILSFIIEQELTTICGVDPAYTRKIKALLTTIASTVPFQVDISKIATAIGLTRNSVLNYLSCMDKAELIRLLYSDLLSVKKMQKPDKIYLNNTNLLFALVGDNADIGTARETFAANQLATCHKVEYGKTAGALVIDGKYTFEIGGADKTFKQIAGIQDSYVLADGIEFSSGNKLPLWIIGMMY